MKSCLSVLILIILIPIFISAIILTSVNNVFFNNENYKQILSSSASDEVINNYLASSIKDNLISKSDEFKILFDNTEGEDTIKSFLNDINAKEQFINNVSKTLDYVKGINNNLDLSIKFNFSQLQFDKFKQNVISILSDGLLSLKPCETNEPNQTNCRSASLNSQDIISRIKDVANNALEYVTLQSYFYAKVPISTATKAKIDEVKSYYSLFNKSIIYLWISIIVILLILILLNVYPKITIFSYISKLSFLTFFILILFIVLSLFLWKRGYYLSSTQLALSSDFSVNTAKSIEELSNKLISELFYYMGINLIAINIIILFIGIISGVLNTLIKKRTSNDDYSRKYYINAFSKQENKINE